MTEKRLLVVDDEPEFCRFVKAVAVDLGYQFAEANDGEEFKRRYLEFDPTTIILDLIMPRTDGFELLKWLVARDCRAEVIVVSGYDTTNSKMAKMIGDEDGVRDIKTLAKPIRLDNLRESLR